MRQVCILVLILNLFFGCSEKLILKENDFVYRIKNYETEKSLAERVKVYKKNVFFELFQTDDGYAIHVIPCEDINKAYLGFLKISKSNRVLVLNDCPYYLVFRLDETIGTIYEKRNVINNSSNSDDCNDCPKIRYNISIIDRGFFMYFDENWDIINKK